MLSNAYFLAKFRFDTAENEPAKNLQNFAKFARILLILLTCSWRAQADLRGPGGLPRDGGRGLHRGRGRGAFRQRSKRGAFVFRRARGSGRHRRARNSRRDRGPSTCFKRGSSSVSKEILRPLWKQFSCNTATMF